MSETPAEPVRKRTWPTLVMILAATLSSAAVVAFLTHSSNAAVYSALIKPGFAPPGWAFPAIWSLLYCLMGTALWLMFCAEEHHAAVTMLYIAQLAVSLLWPVLFLTLKAYGLAFIWLLVLLALILLLMRNAFYRSTLAGWLLTPYAAWVLFSGVLNFMIAQMNP